MSFQHKQLQNGKWHALSLSGQLANIGSEVFRAINWKKKNNSEYSQLAFYRCLELIDLTISDAKNSTRLKEIARLREALADYFIGDNKYASSEILWEHYFLPFNYLARK